MELEDDELELDEEQTELELDEDDEDPHRPNIKSVKRLVDQIIPESELYSAFPSG
jgi:hypothetical protein